MGKPEAVNKTIPIDEDYFCDGHFAVLLSQSLGGSGIDPHKLADILGTGEPESMKDLLSRGVSLPIFFGTDCAMDGGTLFVLGELEERHQEAWIARLSSKLAIPCGKLVLLSGGGRGDELARAISGKPPDKDYCIYQTIDVPPGDYRVEVLAYLKSTTVGFLHEDLDDEALQEKYKDLPEVDEFYVVHLTPLESDVPLPALVDEVNWPGVFELR
jgi:hypothetical protein